MEFGGGFYGVAAAWTLIYIEASGIVEIILHPSVLLEMFHKGIGEFIAHKISDQVTSFVDAATWFSWWPGRGHGPVVWFVVAYGAYLVGLNLARYETGIGRPKQLHRAIRSGCVRRVERVVAITSSRQRNQKPGSASIFCAEEPAPAFS
jgi:hypothetical protein